MAILDITNIPAPRVPITDERTGLISREWYRFLLNLFNLSGGGVSSLTIAQVNDNLTEQQFMLMGG